MADSYYLTIKQIIRETHDVITIIFEPLVNDDVFYDPGQFLTFLFVIDNKKVRRSYSLSSSPHVDSFLAVTIKRLPGGLVSNYLFGNVKVGDTLETLKPMGTFALKPNRQNCRILLLIGAGSGITPLISMAKSTLQVEPDSRIILIYGNRNQNSIIYKSQLEAMERLHGPDRFIVTHMLSQPNLGWQGFEGRITKHTLMPILDNFSIQEIHNIGVYMCGPAGMMEEVQIALNQLGFTNDQMNQESFLAIPVDAVKKEYKVLNDQGSSKVTLLYDDQEYKFTAFSNQTILEAALELGIDLPYSCQMGICSSCKGLCRSGTIRQDGEDALSDDERMNGYILTCVGYAMSDTVTIEIE